MRSSRLPPAAKGVLGLALLALVAIAFRPCGVASPFLLRASATPQTLLLQPDAVNGTDTFVLSRTPGSNFGSEGPLWVGPDALSGGRYRSLLFFDLSAFPGNATLVDAMLSLHETTGIGGTVRASRALASWTEGSGSREWARVPITVRESAGVPRTLEPIAVTLTFPPGSIADPAKDVRVWDGTREVPSQVYRYGYTGGEVSEALLYFGVTIGAFQSKTFDVTYSANGSAVPAYRQLTWSSSPTWTAGPAGVSVTGATIADIDRDGKLEAVFGGDDGVLRIANSTGTVVRSVQVSALGNSIPFPPQVVDLRHNGSVAIIAITNDPSLAGLDTNGNVMWANPAVPLLHTIPAFVDVNGDGVLEILVGGKMKQMQALSGLDGLTVLRNYSVPLEAYTPMVADIDGDGTPEILFGGSDGVVHAFSLGGTELWASAPPRVQFVEMPLAYGDPRLRRPARGWHRCGRLGGQTLADLDGDGTLEILFGNTAGTFYALSANGSPLWSHNPGTVQSGTPAIGDLDRSGTPDIVFTRSSFVTRSPCHKLARPGR